MLLKLSIQPWIYAPVTQFHWVANCNVDSKLDQGLCTWWGFGNRNLRALDLGSYTCSVWYGLKFILPFINFLYILAPTHPCCWMCSILRLLLCDQHKRHTIQTVYIPRWRNSRWRHSSLTSSHTSCCTPSWRLFQAQLINKQFSHE